MSTVNNIEQTGSWAQNEQDIIDILQENGIVPNNSVEFASALSLIGATATAAAENLNLTNGSQSIALKTYIAGNWATIPVTLALVQGQSYTKEIAKAIAGALTANFVGAVGGALASVVGAPVAIAVGTVVVGFFAGNFVANQAGNLFDIWIGPDVDNNPDKRNNIEILTSNYSVQDTIALEIHHGYLTKYENDHYTLKGSNGLELEHEVISGTHVYELKDKSIAEIKSSGIIDVLAKRYDYDEFIFNVSNSADDFYEIINLNHKSQSEIKALIDSDSSVAYAVQNLQSYGIKEYESFDVSDYSQSQKNDLASMLYHHLNPDDESSGVRTAYKNLSLVPKLQLGNAYRY
jgi:hypothetical protein